MKGPKFKCRVANTKEKEKENKKENFEERKFSTKFFW